MHRIAAHSILVGLILVGACASAPHQQVARPDENSAVAANRCRVYLARDENTGAALRNVRVSDNGTLIGRIGNDEYLCWDRPLTQGVGQAFYEGIDPGYSDVENVFALPREAGTTTFLCVRIGSLRKPEIATLSAEEGRALIAKRKPAPAK